MASLDELTPVQLKALETAEKLMRLAGKNTNQHEAEAAAAKAMKILEDLNLDMSVIEQGGSEKVKRSDEKMAGGLYRWQRDLWQAIAQLHFCFYWNQYNFDKTKVNRYQTRKFGHRVMGGYKFEHRVVGRTVNVIATRNMAQYLEHTIERLVREHMSGDSQLFGNYAVSFRQGVAEEIIGKIYERRRHLLREEERKAREAADAAAQSAAAGYSTSRSLTLGSVAKQEEEANYDFLHGEGKWAERKARIEERARREKEAEDEYTAWAAANPEEARKLEEERYKEARRRTSWNAGMRSEKDTRDYGAYRAGRDAGKGVSIEPQTDRTRTAGAIS